MKKLIILSCALLMCVGLTLGGCAKKEKPADKEPAAKAPAEKAPAE